MIILGETTNNNFLKIQITNGTITHGWNTPGYNIQGNNRHGMKEIMHNIQLCYIT